MTNSQSPARELRYVVLYHSGIDEPHFDLLVETQPGSDLAAWRSPVWPIESPISLQRLKDHRRIYLQYQGELSGRRGHVRRVADGACQVVIGENSVWNIRFSDGNAIELLMVQADQWTASASPSKGRSS